MLDILNPEVLLRLIEIPMVLAFIIFAAMLFRYFQAWSNAKDKMHIERMERSETNWRNFLTEQRDAFLKSINEITCEITEVKKRQEDHSKILAEHDKKLDIAIAIMHKDGDTEIIETEG
jgi:hypothetical protein